MIVLQLIMILLLYSAGTFGVVSVEWFIDAALTTAVRGVDYLVDGATLTFQPHETLKGNTCVKVLKKCRMNHCEVCEKTNRISIKETH